MVRNKEQVKGENYISSSKPVTIHLSSLSSNREVTTVFFRTYYYICPFLSPSPLPLLSLTREGTSISDSSEKVYLSPRDRDHPLLLNPNPKSPSPLL